MRKLLGILLTGALAFGLLAGPPPSAQAAPTTQLVWASDTTLTGLAGQAKGRVSPAAAGATGFVEVRYGGGWARVASATTTASGEFIVPLAYGVSVTGRYTFRLGTVVAGAVSHSREWTVTRAPEASERLVADLGSGISALLWMQDNTLGVRFLNRGTVTFGGNFSKVSWDPQPNAGNVYTEPGQTSNLIQTYCPRLPRTLTIALPEMTSWYEDGHPGDLISVPSVQVPNPCTGHQLLAAPIGRWTGQPGVARGRVWPAKAGETAFVEVAYGSRWVRIAASKTDARGEFSVPSPTAPGRRTRARSAWGPSSTANSSVGIRGGSKRIDSSRSR